MNQYITLFKEICSSAEILAEQVMELDQKNNDLEGYNVAQQMRQDYANLGDKIKSDDFQLDMLVKQDYLKLLAASYMITNNLLDKITSLKKAVSYYKTFLNAKLERVVNESNDEESLKIIVNEVFADET